MFDWLRFRQLLHHNLDPATIADTITKNCAGPEWQAGAQVLYLRVLHVLDALKRAKCGSCTGSGGRPRIYRAMEEFYASSPERFSQQNLSVILTRLRKSGFTVTEVLRAHYFLEVVVLQIIVRRLVRTELGARVSQNDIDFQYLRDLIVADHDLVISVALEFDSVLLQDPANSYGAMCFRAKNEYRSAVARLAKSARKNETDIANMALRLANEKPNDPIEGHIGYYLIDKGRARLKSGSRKPFCQRVPESHLNLIAHFATVIGITGLILFGYARMFHPGHNALQLIFMACVLILSLDLGSKVFWCVVNNLYEHRPCPTLKSISVEHKTLVAVPTLLVDERQVDALITSLAKSWRDFGRLGVRCVCLADYEDSARPMPSDRERYLLTYLTAKICSLNAKLCENGNEQFLLTIRDRRWNERQNRWMGWERKRGKIESLFREVVQGTSELRFIVGSPNALNNCAYAIVMDEDNTLQPGATGELVGTISHPLNAPVLSADGSSLLRGHAAISPSCSIKTRLLTPPEYRRNLVFDWYKDTTLVGKGVYDIYATLCLLRNKFADNRVLSHDTYESLWLSPGYCATAHIMEGYPSSYVGIIERQHRWTRGDWQNAMLIMSSPLKHLYASKVALLAVARQLRESIFALVMFAAVVLVCAYGTDKNGRLMSILVLGFSYQACSIAAALTLSGQRAIGSRTTPVPVEHWLKLLLIIPLEYIQIPVRAAMAADAILVTAWRYARKRNLLSWRSAATLDRHHGVNRAKVWMWSSWLVVLGVVVAVVAPDRSNGASIVAWLLPWLATPFLLPRIRKGGPAER